MCPIMRLSVRSGARGLVRTFLRGEHAHPGAHALLLVCAWDDGPPPPARSRHSLQAVKPPHGPPPSAQGRR